MDKARHWNKKARGTYKHALKIVDLCEKLYNQGRADNGMQSGTFDDVKDMVFAEVMDIMKLPAKKKAFNMKKTQFSSTKKASKARKI